MAILDPIKVIITNYPEGDSEKVTVPNNPENEDDGTRELTFTREFWIERDDFMIDAPKKYFRLKPGGAVRLRGAYIIQHTDHLFDDDGEILEIHCHFLSNTIGQSAPEGVQCRTAIHWVSCQEAVSAEVRLYDRLFTEEVPDSAEGGYLSCLNPDSLSVVTNAQVEPSLAAMAAGERCQFERIGYFCADAEDHTLEKPVFNRISTLRDSWGSKK
jgi:glutaminyl-tRNA synthetase